MNRPSDPMNTAGLHYLGVAPVDVGSGGRIGPIDRTSIRFAPEFGGTQGGSMASRTQRRQIDLINFGTKLSQEGHRAAVLGSSFGKSWEGDAQWAGDDGFGVWEGDTQGAADDGFGRRRHESRRDVERRLDKMRDRAHEWEAKARKRHTEIQTLRAKVAKWKDSAVSLKRKWHDCKKKIAQVEAIAKKVKGQRRGHMDSLKAERTALKAEKADLAQQIVALKASETALKAEIAAAAAAAAAAAPPAHPLAPAPAPQAGYPAHPQAGYPAPYYPQYPPGYATYPAPHPNSWNAGYSEQYSPYQPQYDPALVPGGSPAYWDQGYNSQFNDPWTRGSVETTWETENDARYMAAANALMQDNFGRASRPPVFGAVEEEDPYTGYLGGCGCG